MENKIFNRKELSETVVLITGALTGIGRATAIAFANEKAKIVISGRHEEKGSLLAKELRAYGAEAEFIRADVRNENDIKKLVEKTIAKFGRLDAAVNNAGTEGTPGMLDDQTEETYRATFDTNVLGTMLSMKHELRAMKTQGYGSVINISSTYGQEGAAGASVYAASKHAVEGFTKSAALEVASQGIRVNVVAPGPTETGMLTRFTGTEENKNSLKASVPAGRIGTPQEVAHLIVFLASDKSPFLTGQIIAIDGGKLAG